VNQPNRAQQVKKNEKEFENTSDVQGIESNAFGHFKDGLETGLLYDSTGRSSRCLQLSTLGR
jgi:hypothetical protein